MIATHESTQAELAAIVGASRVLIESAACQKLAVDGLAPKCVVYPQSAEQAAAALGCAADHGLAVIPSRSATKINVGNIPRRYDIALSMKEVNNVWHYEPADLTASVEAGVKLGDLQNLLARDGLWLPLDPPGGAAASLGGIAATNATGPLRLFYGAPRDMVLGMKIATADGKIVKTGGRVVKNVAGYDLSKLLIGSYGTLGVIVEVNLKLFPLPAERVTFTFQVPTLDAARELRRRILHSPLTPMRMVLMDAEASKLVSAGPPGSTADGEFALWVEAGGSKRVVERYARELDDLGRELQAPVRSLAAGDAEGGWARIADLRTCLANASPGVVILRASLPISASENFVNRARQECDRAKSRSAVFAQTGSGVVHLAIIDITPLMSILGVVTLLRNIADDLHGALVVERCSPELKSQVDVWGAPGNDIEIMRHLKQALDPKSVLSPGRFLGSL